jgi:excisionase family DNA binding protein
MAIKPSPITPGQAQLRHARHQAVFIPPDRLCPATPHAAQSEVRSLPDPLFVSMREAGRRLGVGLSTIWKLIQAGELPSTQILRRRLVSVTDLEKFAARLQQSGGGRHD